MIKKQAVRTFVFCLMITFIIAAGLTFSDPPNYLGYLISSFIYTMCIGFTIHTLIVFAFPRITKLPTVYRLSLLLMLFLVGGLAGTGISVAIHKLVFNYSFTINDYSRLLSFNLFLSIIFGSIAVLYFTLKANAERMESELKEKELNEEKLTRLKMKAELEALQAKINPHFLFNTLNSIASLISENPKAAESTVEKLSELFRYTLQCTANSTVKLTEELEIVRSYLQIEKIRFGNRLEFEIICDDRLNNFDVPALLIQPLVENSIKHALAFELHGGSICVEAKQIDNECHISVTDSGKGFAAETDETGFGLKSVRERLKLLYGNKATLNVFHDGRTHINISIPIS